MVTVAIWANDSIRDDYLDRGLRQFTRLPAVGEIVELRSRSGARLVRVETVIHSVDRATHSAEIVCRWLGDGPADATPAAVLLRRSVDEQDGDPTTVRPSPVLVGQPQR